ncbi:MAG TPA: FtsW/RodA/SpoVE family cell cycle protein, partial [Cyclobacteriaceae bacterium]|nr:FtsW/RodA/SpoVE family cell cycle protein [Cyclobacteriaceae bacterium]
MRRDYDISGSIDWPTVFLYLALVAMGWANVFASVYDESARQSIFDLSLNSGRQLLFIIASIIIAFAITIVDMRFYETFAYILYGVLLILLFLVPLIGKEVGGN